MSFRVLKNGNYPVYLKWIGRELANQPVSGVLGYDQEHWRNPASIAVIRPDDVFDGGHYN